MQIHGFFVNGPVPKCQLSTKNSATSLGAPTTDTPPGWVTGVSLAEGYLHSELRDATR